MTYTHVHVSEVPDSPVVECTTAAVLEVARARMVNCGQPPATGAEREALRTVSGASDSKGADLWALQKGVRLRYDGIMLPVATLPDLAAVPEGTFMAVQGNYHDLPSHFQRWDYHFSTNVLAGHCVTVFKRDGRLWWCDPLAPWGKDPSEPVTANVVAAYFHALPLARVMTAHLTLPPTGPRVRVVLPAFWTYTVRGSRVVGNTLEAGQRLGAAWTVDAAHPVRVRSMDLVRLTSGPHEGRWVNPHGPLAYSPR